MICHAALVNQCCHLLGLLWTCTQQLPCEQAESDTTLVTCSFQSARVQMHPGIS